MAGFNEYASLDATALAGLVRDKQVQPAELVDAAIGRIERLNPSINAVITPMFDEARARAEGDLPDGPFRGVPFLLKDLIAEYAGVRQADGTDFTGDFVADRDSELVERLKRAGLIVVGKTNTPELGILPTTEPRRFGPTRNPWGLNHSPGGSSGGSAAAVAARMVPMAHGNDGGGSIRIPASCCGLFGLKPTRGRNPMGPHFGDLMSGLIVEHAVTRSVRDSAALLDATSGPSAGDPYYAPPPDRPFAGEVGIDPGGLRIGFTTDPGSGAAIHDDSKGAAERAARLCEELGHRVEEVRLEVDQEKASQGFVTVWFSGFAWEIDEWAKRLGKEPKPDDFEPLTWALCETGKQYTAAAYLAAVRDLQEISRDLATQLAGYDVLLTPTVSEPPPPLGAFDSPPDNPLLGFLRAAEYVPFTPICNITGQPAMSVPLYWNQDGLPVGAHFVGKYADERTLFRLAAQLEQAQPWADRYPPIG